MSLAGRCAVVAAYVLAFWVALPLGLWASALRLDEWLGLSAPRSGLGVAVGAAGLSLLGWSMSTLWREGGGLPVSALPPPRLATGGPYRFSRHPIYLGFDVAVLGAGLAAGSPALASIVAPLLLPAWMAWATVEERGLERRFGDAWRSYRRRVGMLSPRFAIHAVGFALLALQVLPCRVRGREHVPRRGGALLVYSHACYLDFVFAAAAAAPRRLAYLVTAESFRHPLLRFLLRRGINVPVRRYRTEPAACREALRLLAAGHLVAIAPEAERATLGRRLPPLPRTARVLARLSRLGWPVVPVAVSGSYDAGPRWAGRLRRRRATVRAGPALDLSGGDPAATLDAALGRLTERDPQPVHLDGLDRRRLALVLWRCPACLVEGGWQAAELACARCGARWEPTAEGLFRGPDGGARTLAEVASPVWDAPELTPLRARVRAARERSMYGPIEPLVVIGDGILEVSAEGLRFGTLRLDAAGIRSTGIERNDTLQVAGGDGMWQFRVLEGSAFRLERALSRWRAEGAR